jgi:hypothetical protein
MLVRDEKMMRLKFEKLPCAYCGRNEGTCHRGHTIPDCMYPDGSQITKITVPECHVCKEYWQDDDAHFRAVVLLCGEPNDQVNAKWPTVVRSFRDRRCAKDLQDMMVSVEVSGVQRHKLYPMQDDRVVRVLKRIVRGLCYKHGLGSRITEEQVFVDVLRYAIPPAFQTEFKRESLDDAFCWYEYSDRRGKDDGEFHSVWVIEFYGRTRFFCLVSASASGWAADAA